MSSGSEEGTNSPRSYTTELQTLLGKFFALYINCSESVCLYHVQLM